MMAEWFWLTIPFVTDVLRVMVTASFCAVAIEIHVLRNGTTSRHRFGTFMLMLAVATSWFNLTYFDRRFNVIPWADLERIGRDWNWVVYLLLLITLTRFWQALRRPA